MADSNELHEYIRLKFAEQREDFRELNRKVDELAAFRWALLGGSLAASSLVSLAVAIFVAK